MEMEKNSTLKYGIWLTGASMMFVSAWFCVRLTGTVGEMGRYLDSMGQRRLHGGTFGL